MKKRLSKALAALLALAMVVALVPTMALAEESITLAAEQSSVSADSSVTSIKLNLTAETTTFQETITSNPTWFTLSGDPSESSSITVTTVARGETGKDATLTLSKGLTKAGELTITVDNQAFSEAPSSGNTATVTVTAGEPSQISVVTEPTAPETNGGSLGNPIVKVVDKNNNTIDGKTVKVEKADTGNWTLGGTDTQSSSTSGQYTFSGLTATSKDGSAVNGAKLKFSVQDKEDVTCESTTFDIPASKETGLKKVTVDDTEVNNKTYTGGSSVNNAADLGSMPVEDLSNVQLKVTPQSAVSSILYMLSEEEHPSEFSSAGSLSGSGAEEYTCDPITISDNYYIIIEVTAMDNSAKGYYSVQISQGPVKPTVTVAPTEINAGTKDPTVTLTSNLDFDNDTTDNYGFSDDSTGLTVQSITHDGKKATVKLQGTAKTGSFSFTVTQAAFGEEKASSPAEAATVTVNAVTPNISVSPSTINVGTAADAITLTVTSNLPFKSELSKSDFEIKLNSETTGLTECTVVKDTSETAAKITFTGDAAKAGEITIQAKADAYDNMASSVSNEVKVTISAPAPTTPPAPSTTVDQPATDTDSGTTTVDVNTNSTTSGTTANATVPSSSMDRAVDSAVSAAESAGTAPVVEVEVKTSSQADGIRVTLPTGALDKLAAVEDAELIITSDVAEVALDSTAIGAVAEQAGATAVLSVTPSKTLNAAQTEAADGAPVYDLTLTSNGEEITEFDGGVLTITVPYALPEGNDASTVRVSYLDDEGDLTPCATVYDAAAGKVVFETTHLSKYVITSEEVHVCPSDKFTDVDKTKWYHEAVDFMVEKGIMIGVSGDKFDPEGVTFRGTIMTMLARMKGVDTTGSEPWYQAGVDWAVEAGVSDGIAPDRKITRAELVTMLYRYIDEPEADVAVLDGFDDGDAVPEWAVEAMAWAVANGLVEGRGGPALASTETATRAEVAKIVMVFCGLTGN